MKSSVGAIHEATEIAPRFPRRAFHLLGGAGFVPMLISPFEFISKPAPTDIICHRLDRPYRLKLPK